MHILQSCRYIVKTKIVVREKEMVLNNQNKTYHPLEMFYYEKTENDMLQFHDKTTHTHRNTHTFIP